MYLCDTKFLVFLSVVQYLTSLSFLTFKMAANHHFLENFKYIDSRYLILRRFFAKNANVLNPTTLSLYLNPIQNIVSIVFASLLIK